MDSDEACVTMAKICEWFIEDVTIRASTKAKQYGGSTIEGNHMVDAIVDEKTRDSLNRDDWENKSFLVKPIIRLHVHLQMRNICNKGLDTYLLFCSSYVNVPKFYANDKVWKTFIGQITLNVL